MGNNLNFPKVYIDIMHDMMAHGISPNAQTTIEGLKNLYFYRKKIAAIDNEAERNGAILRTCHVEVDRGFLKGKNEEERLAEIDDKLRLLTDSYDDAKKSGNLEHYFYSAFESDSHLNHRLERLEHFYKEHKGKKVSAR